MNKPEDIKKDQTFQRLLNCLQTRLELSDYHEVERAVNSLQTVNQVRVALQHSGAFRELHTAMTKLGIPYPHNGAVPGTISVQRQLMRYVSFVKKC